MNKKARKEYPVEAWELSSSQLKPLFSTALARPDNPCSPTSRYLGTVASSRRVSSSTSISNLTSVHLLHRSLK